MCRYDLSLDTGCTCIHICSKIYYVGNDCGSSQGLDVSEDEKIRLSLWLAEKSGRKEWRI